MRVHVVGGFLGAGKTTLVRALARHLHNHQERVAIVTNDQGHALVDTYLCKDAAESVTEIAGGCFCCRYDDLEQALEAAEAEGATVAIAEAVGSCTDLVATVLSPLALRRPEWSLAPLAIVVDPWRLQQVESGRADELVAYLYMKQIQEADVVLVTRADMGPPDVGASIRAHSPHAAVLRVSGRKGEGIDDWLAARPERSADPLHIDYGTYADAEALLGWANGVVRFDSETGFDPRAVVRRVLERLTDEPVAHVKVAAVDPQIGSGSLILRHSAPILDLAADASPVSTARYLVNARVALPPDILSERLREVVGTAEPDAVATWEGFECFRPVPPKPTHRHVFRCGTDGDAACCASVYERTDVRYLLGDSWHPGGVVLSQAMADRMDLPQGGALLDVACGRATSLQAIAETRTLRAVGLDAGWHGISGETEGLELHRGDAHHIPFAEECFDGVLCECAVSTFPDPGQALSEMYRVLMPGGRIAVSDMVVEGEVPSALHGWVHVGTCLLGARRFSGYLRLLEEAGFEVVESWDASAGLYEMLARIRRNLLGIALAKATGSLPTDVAIDVKEGRDILRLAEEAVDSGAIRYGAYIAERPRV